MIEPPRYESFLLSGDLRLCVNSNRKLKTILVKVFLTADLDETVTRRALLPLVLRRGTRRLPDMQSLSRHLEGLYGASLYSSVSKVGEWHVSKYHLEVVNDRFLPRPEGLFPRGLELLRDLLLDPHRVDGGFSRKYVDQETENLRRQIESLVDDKGAYAVFRCVEEMCREEPFRWNEQGRVKDLPAIERVDLYESYRQWIATCPLAVYVAGDVEVSAVRHAVEEAFDLGRRAVQPLSPAPSPVSVGAPREIREPMEVHQGKLVLGFRHGVTYGDVDEYAALLIMNGVLGGFSHSKLFQNVREKASMAYSASSWVEKTKGLLFISCGIAVENYERALEVILEQVEAMERGDITDDEIDATAKTMINHNLMLEDDFSSLAEIDHVWRLNGRTLDLLALREQLAGVRREQIVEVARKLKHDTTYFLHSTN